MPLSHSMCMTPAEGGGASTLHHMCVDTCELADDRMHVKQCILYPSQDILCQVAFIQHFTCWNVQSALRHDL